MFRALKNEAKNNGYITFDEIIAFSEKADLSLIEIDAVTGQLINEGFLVLESSPAEETGESVDDSDYDKSQLDYEEIFSEVLGISPGLSDYINEIRNIPAPRKGEEAELIVLAKEGNKYATDRLTLMFLKVVVKQALYFHKKYGLPLEETIQEGNIGLLVSLEKFNLVPGNRFSTYAPWWVRQNILRNTTGICDKFYTPVYLQEKLLKIIDYIGPQELQELQGNLLQTINIPKAAKATCIRPSEIRHLLLLLEEPYSLEEMIENFVDSSVQESNMENDVIDQIHSQFLSNFAFSSLEIFSERYRKIIQMRHGFNGFHPMTLEEIAKIMKITRERVRQIETKTMSKMKTDFHKIPIIDQ